MASFKQPKLGSDAARTAVAAYRQAKRAARRAARQAALDVPTAKQALQDVKMAQMAYISRPVPELETARPKTVESAKVAGSETRNALAPDKVTLSVILSMSKFVRETKAADLHGATMRPFLNDLATFIVHQMRANVAVGGVGGKSEVAVGTRLTRFQTRDKTTPLTDTGDMARVLSADFHVTVSGRHALRIGPLGTTAWSIQAGIDTIEANERPTSLPPFFATVDITSGAERVSTKDGESFEREVTPSVGAPQKSTKLTYPEVAWLQELGWSFQVTDAMADMFQSLGGFNKNGVKESDGHPIFGEGAALLYRAMSYKSQRGGRVPAVGKVLTVPARPFMRPAMEKSANLVAVRWPAVSAQVFNDWVATGPMRKRMPDGTILQGHVATPKNFVTFASPIGAAMRNKAVAKLIAAAGG